MNCHTCHYSLWNVRARLCPECGTPFSVRSYAFTTNSVQFKCPHCDQSYYGLNPENGHIDPDLFEIFLKQGVYQRYAEQFLEPEQIDAVNEADLLT